LFRRADSVPLPLGSVVKVEKNVFMDPEGRHSITFATPMAFS